MDEAKAAAQQAQKAADELAAREKERSDALSAREKERADALAAREKQGVLAEETRRRRARGDGARGLLGSIGTAGSTVGAG